MRVIVLMAMIVGMAMPRAVRMHMVMLVVMVGVLVHLTADQSLPSPRRRNRNGHTSGSLLQFHGFDVEFLALQAFNPARAARTGCI